MNLLRALPLIASLCCSLPAIAQCPSAGECPVTAQCADPRAKPRLPSEDEPATVKAEAGERSANGDMLLRGNVEVRQGDRVLRANEVEYRAENEDFYIPGAVEVSDPHLILRGQGAEVDPEGAAQVDNTTFEIPARAGHGSAARIRISEDGELDMRDVRYTTCPMPNPAWELRVGRLRVDQQAQIGTGVGIRVDFKGVPILYTPYISFPVGDEPKSGLLFPEFGHSTRSGWKFSLPWYWRISDSEDATFTPSFYTARGADLGGEFRFLRDDSEGQLNVHYLPNDRLTGTDRTFAELSTQVDLSSHVRFTAAGVNLGDRAWLEDFGGGHYNSLVALPRVAELAYRDDHWTIAARALNYQVIDPLITRANRPYTLLPQVAVDGFFPELLLGLTGQFNGEFVAFKRRLDEDTTLNSQRLDLRPEIRLPLRGTAMHLEPAAAVRYTAYRLDPALGVPETELSRTAPILSVEGGMVFERAARRRRLQTFEPRALYAYVPYREQSSFPVFTTAPRDFNLAQLFETERYVGPDRLGDTHHIALGATSRLLDADGRQLLAATVGELYRLDTQRVVLPGELPERRGSSDVIGELDLTTFRDWTAHIGVQWDPQDTRTERAELFFQYRESGTQVVNLGYRYRRRDSLATTIPVAAPVEGLQQVDASAAWSLGNAWSLYGRFVYSLKDKTPIERVGGFEYRSCCWSIRILARSSVSTLTAEPNWEVKAQLELTGLSNVGNPVDTFLAQSIPGYSAVRNDFSSTPVSFQTP